MNFNKDNPYIILDFVNEEKCKQRKVFSNPREVIMARNVSEVKEALQRVEQYTKEGYYAAGYVSYEAAPAFDSAFRVHQNTVLPLLWFGIFDHDHGGAVHFECEKFEVSAWSPTIEETTYNDHIRQIHEAIRRGDTYQVNYTMRLRSSFEGNPYNFYTRLCLAQQADYSAMLHMGDFSILSASPELFFKKKGRQIETRPMKGTVRRGVTLEEDKVLSEWLRNSDKNRAENVMITDLLRNDLGVIAEPGSVDVPSLFNIEKYYTLFQMTSTVTANIKEDTGLFDTFKALFPCGSITGAPKISTMHLIQELEHTPREIYCGSIGVINPDGSAIFNVAIRTVWIDHRTDQAEYGVGGGITWDSTAEEEYQEARTKALLLTEVRPEFQLLESIRLENGIYDLLDPHLQRMKNSAAYFEYEGNWDLIRQALLQHSTQHKDGIWKTRLLLSKNGSFNINNEPITNRNGVNEAVLAQSPISSANRFLYHKTTYREIYNGHYEKRGQAYDVLLWNENREITEFTTGNVVFEINNMKFTPPIHCGLLGGTLRNELVQSGLVVERVLTMRDLIEASQIWLINSVRGWISIDITQESLDQVIHELNYTLS
ncbi:aminodeoxychorismate synthase component I [Paenibacillus provencensis]|uniref:Aminodeoxychorismate synthase component I n=1 Tax=Paenibacillus provencensis TaxID=441151 RepID=A0ABW3PMK6_9BACL|nr:aminodeoxychorismate synthase component I [Paenibacillus sp. MER 78]MCM3126804.1 aminodeoxychorismate synthase component I [Paenibacillus sp. MER 78]